MSIDDLASLANIRDSVVIGQMLGQQAALDARIAEQGARLQANHPTMRALSAQKTALASQIDAEADGIAAALDTEATLDDAQITLLRSRLTGVSSTAAPDPAASGALEVRAAAQRVELDSLVDAHFGLNPDAAIPVSRAISLPTILAPLNLVVVVVAVIGWLALQFSMALRRRRIAHDTVPDLTRWRRDPDPELRAEPPVSQLRRVS